MAKRRGGKKKAPKIGATPPGREIRVGADPQSTDTETICWQTGLMDREHPDWGWQKIRSKVWWHELLPRLKHLESMTWGELKQVSGGRRRGTNHHFVQVRSFSKRAKDRLAELQLDDHEQLFSIRLTGSLRLYGVTDGRALKLVWHDPHHGDNSRAVYPVGKRHT